MYGRMALILMLLQDDEFEPLKKKTYVSELRCNNPKCITAHEEYLPNLCYDKKDMVMCDYCDKRID